MSEYQIVFLCVILTLGLVVFAGNVSDKYRKLISMSGALILIVFFINWFGGYNNILLVCGAALIGFANKGKNS
jgi:energy-coupling factor transporter transmembrane protein EcfT